MKKITSLLLLFCLTLVVQAQKVQFRFSSQSAVPAALRTRMETNATNLLNEIHAACKGNRNLRLQNIQMEAAAKQHLTSLWNVTHFYLDDTDIVQDCLEDVDGYQSRDIAVTLKPVDKEAFRGETERYLTISFNKRGQLTGARFALPNTNVQQILKNGNAVMELAERRNVLKFLEDFMGYYNERDTAALRQVYSEDALIITGSVVQRRVRGDFACTKQEIRYQKQTKNEYLEKLKGIFKRNKHFRVEFDKIEVVSHGKAKGFYGVKVHQKWSTDRYKDDGWVFLLWEFRKDANGNDLPPLIHVRTWQPYTVPDSDIFTLGDFTVSSEK